MKKILVLAVVTMFFMGSALVLAGDKTTVPVPDELKIQTNVLTPMVQPAPEKEVSITNNGDGVQVKPEVRDRIHELSDVKTQEGPATRQK